MSTAGEIHGFNAVNRGVYLADNLDFLRALNDECIDLVCIDPPFDKNETFTAERLRPPLTEAERQNELRLLARWGIATPEQAADRGLEWPPDNAVRGGYKDIWRWEQDIHQEWLDTIETAHPAVHSLIEATRADPQQRPGGLPLLYRRPPPGNPPGTKAHGQPLPALRP